MSREIKFRGKRVDNRMFVTGDLIHGVGVKKGKVYILPKLVVCGCTRMDGFEVIPDTVGQYTGMEDKNGKKVFGGDRIRGHRHFTDSVEIATVSWSDKAGAFLLDTTMGDYGGRRLRAGGLKRFEVIGNIHDNPELLAQ